MEGRRIDAEREGGGDGGLTVIDVSALDDVFLCSSEDSGILDDKLNISKDGENTFLLSESTESDISLKNNRYNIRKSLAWDSAFLTGEGVLEPEELSRIIKGTDNRGTTPRHTLYDVPEDLSTPESISTFASDSLSLETLEADLFGDIRASTQKSSRASNLRLSDKIQGVEGIESTRTPRAKIIDPRRGNIGKTPLKKPTGSLQGHAKQVKLGYAGAQSLKENKKSSSSVSLRPPKTNGKVSVAANATSTRQPKRMLVGVGGVKSESNKSGSTRAGPLGTVSNPGSSRNGVHKTTSSSKPSVSLSTTTSVSSSCNSTSSFSGDHNQISSLSSLQRKPNRTGKLPLTGSNQRTTPKVGSKGKVQPATSRLSAHLKSSSKQSSSLSPASSISARSSPSSTSGVTGKKLVSGSKKCFGLNERKSAEKNDTQALQAYLVERSLNEQEQEKKVEKVPGRYPQKSLARNVSSSNPLSEKPSGLRMPSPKIGFFDGVKTGARTPVGGMQSRSGLSTTRLGKSGAGNSSPPGVTNKCRPTNSSVKSGSKVMVSPAKISIVGLSESALVHTSTPEVKGEECESKLSRLSNSKVGRKNTSRNLSKSSPRVGSNAKPSTEKMIMIQEKSHTRENTNVPEVGKTQKKELSYQTDLSGLRTPFADKNASVNVDLVEEASMTRT